MSVHSMEWTSTVEWTIDYSVRTLGPNGGASLASRTMETCAGLFDATVPFFMIAGIVNLER